ncbi:hypothetical protein G3I24_40730, partial [Micromonospora aurantiaca]|nr:hypothetical protein [Micromonospora aurantiaca]
VAALRAAGDDPVEVRAGEAFTATANGFRLRPGVRADAEELVAALGADLPRRIVHAFALDGDPAGTDAAAAWAAQERGFFGALHLV